MGEWEAFEEDQAYVREEFRKGFIDYVEIISHVAETRFFEFLLEGGHLDALAQGYPSPRKKHDVPLLVYIASELTLRLHGATGFAAYPFVIHAGGLKEALRQAEVRYDAPGGRARMVCGGYNDKNDYPRLTPCHHDFLRKFARDTKAEKLTAWFASSMPALYQRLGLIDAAGIVIADGAHLFIPDNKDYEGSATGYFDEHNRFVKEEGALTPEQQKRCRYRRYYNSVSLLHVDRALTQFLHLGQRVLWKAESENPPLGPMMDAAADALGEKVIKVLIHDKGFIDGERTAHLKTQRGIDSVFPLKEAMLDLRDARRLAESMSPQVWTPPVPAPPPIPPERPAAIREREHRRQETLRKRKASQPAPVHLVRVELKAVRDLKLWEACSVPIHVVLLRDVLSDGTTAEWALATTRSFEDPVEIWDLYKLRTAIEERHRQLKCFWDLSRFRSRSYSLVVNQVIFTVMAYSLMQCFLVKAERDEYTSTTRRRLLEQLLPDGQRVCVFRNNLVGYFTPLELLKEALHLPEGPKRRLMGTVQRLCSRALAAPDIEDPTWRS